MTTVAPVTKLKKVDGGKFNYHMKLEGTILHKKFAAYVLTVLSCLHRKTRIVSKDSMRRRSW